MTTLAAGPRLALKVGLGQIAASAEPERALSALGLGSCIGLVMVDPSSGVVGMAHVMLPESALAPAGGPAGKYADTAVPALIEAVCDLGADVARLVVKMAGGAQMFTGAGAGGLNIGTRNAVAVRAALSAAGLRLRAADTGGNAGRTLEVVAGTGLVTVRQVGGQPQTL
jgi:chemotaxis protein CheD